MWKLYSLVSLHNATCFVLSNIKNGFRILSNRPYKKKKKIEKPMFTKMINFNFNRSSLDMPVPTSLPVSNKTFLSPRTEITSPNAFCISTGSSSLDMMYGLYPENSIKNTVFIAG